MQNITDRWFKFGPEETVSEAGLPLQLSTTVFTQIESRKHFLVLDHLKQIYFHNLALFLMILES